MTRSKYTTDPINTGLECPSPTTVSTASLRAVLDAQRVLWRGGTADRETVRTICAAMDEIERLLDEAQERAEEDWTLIFT